MLPLSFAKAGDKVLVVKIGGKEEVKKHLEDLGFVVGVQVEVNSAVGDGNVIVNVKDS